MVEQACDELKDSVRLRKFLGIVLNIGNRLNTAGHTTKGKAGAFTIDSLLKLNQAKAFDKKTTFLHYIVLIVMRHNQGLTNFKDDLPSVLKADKIYWDQIENDLEEVENQLENVRKIALHEVLGKNRASWSRRRKNTGDDDDMSQDSMSLEEEVESLRSTRIGIFTLQAIKIVSALRESVELTRSKFKKVLEYFGEEDKKHMNPHELFEIICIFTKDFNAAKEKVSDLEKEKLRHSRKKQGVRSQSPSNRSRDSSWSKTSKEQDTPTRIDNHAKPLRASSLQPHFNEVFRGSATELRANKEFHTPNTSFISDDNSFNPEERVLSRSIGHRSKEVPTFDSERNHQTNHSCSGESDRSDDADACALEEKMISDDSKEGYDENLVPEEPTQSMHFDTRNERPTRSVREFHQHQEEEGARPFQVVERNMAASHNTAAPSAQIPEEKQQPMHDLLSSAQTTRERARAMRQQRTNTVQQNSANDAHPAPARRKPPTPETSRPSRPPPAPEDSNTVSPPSSARDRIISRRERLARRQRSGGRQI